MHIRDALQWLSGRTVRLGTFLQLGRQMLGNPPNQRNETATQTIHKCCLTCSQPCDNPDENILGICYLKQPMDDSNSGIFTDVSGEAELSQACIQGPSMRCAINSFLICHFKYILNHYLRTRPLKCNMNHPQACKLDCVCVYECANQHMHFHCGMAD